MHRKTIFILLASIWVVFAANSRYEAEDAIVDENSVQKITDESASGGYYINMKEGDLLFKVNIEITGFYSIWTYYSQPSDASGKIQNLTVNGSSAGQMSFPKVDSFVFIKSSSKVKLSAGQNTIGINKSWGWVNIDYIEILPHEPTPFSISSRLVSSNASLNTQKMYSFIKDNFQKKIISGVMTNTVMLNDGNYTPNEVENQTEVAWIKDASGKIPALLGLDFLHATGLGSDNEWHIGYTNATVVLADKIFKKGGIPVFCWHWMDPSMKVETFYTPNTTNTPVTDFNLKNAFTDSTFCKNFNTNSNEYKAIIRDIDIIAGYLKKLADKNIPILWRPLHEASGKWFWWGYKGPEACKALYKLLFERLTKHHGLNNLIWVWTTDEAGDALDWYPGDEYVDIIGRDYYYYPREANHNSLVASFEKVKEIFGGKKIVALSENGSIPFPDTLINHGAGWSYFMPWYGDYTMDGWAHDNTANDWKHIMNHEYVITLDEMPGWEDYSVLSKMRLSKDELSVISISHRSNNIEISTGGMVKAVELYNLQGVRVAVLSRDKSANNYYSINSGILKNGLYLLKVKSESTCLCKPLLVKK